MKTLQNANFVPGRKPVHTEQRDTAQWQDLIERATGYDPNPLNNWPIPSLDIRGLVDLTKNYKAHAERLAKSVRRMIDSPNSFEARQECIKALAAWEGAQ